MKTQSPTKFLFRALVTPLCWLGAGSLFGQVSFYGIGNLPGGGLHSEVRDAVVTPGGIVAVGSAGRFSDSGDTSVQWSPAGGLVILANPFPASPATAFITARTLSADGSTIGGSTRGAATGNLRRACLWTAGGTAVNTLPFISGSGTPNVGVNALSAYGTVAYGFNVSTGGVQPFRHTAAGGMVGLGFLNPGDNFSVPAPHGASADGAIMAGTSTVDILPGLGAFRYVYTGSGPTGGTMIALPVLPGSTFNGVCALTPDGSKTLGVSDGPGFPNGQAILWNQGGPTVALGTPDVSLTPFSGFGGVTADASTAAMAFGDDDGNGSSYIRNPSGWFELQGLVAAAGVDLTGWSLSNLLGMSPDGLLVYGSGLHNGSVEGWIVRFPAGYLRAYGDTTAPVFTNLSVSPSVLRPPNHKMVNVVVTAHATDAISAVNVHIVSITSNESDNGQGDGNTGGDIVITGPLTAQLRAERSGQGNGRIYTLTVAATDAAGNTSIGLLTVTVPK